MDSQVPNIVAESPEVFPVVPQTPQISTSPQKIKDDHWISILAMAIFIVLSLGVVAFLYYQNQALKSMLASYNTPAPIVSPISTATADPTASWRQIISKNWSFKAPSDLHYNLVEPDENAIVLDPTIKSDIKSQGGFDGSYLIAIQRITSPYPIPTTIPAINNTTGYSISVSNKSNITIDGKPAIYQTETQTGGQFPGTNIRAYMIDGTVTYIFGLNDITQKDLFDQILSTFKFIETTPTPTSFATPTPTIIPSAVPSGY